MRTAKIERNTKETQITLSLALEGGDISVGTGAGFLDHMLELLAVHSGFGLQIKCKGDTEVDFHHTTEDVGIALGLALKEALGDKRGIARFADKVVPMDETAALVALDISGRPYLSFCCKLEGKIGTFDAELVEEFFRAFSTNAGVNLYVALLRGGAGRAGITDISQKSGVLRFELENFDMERVSELYARPEYRGRLRVEAGNTPRLTLKLPPKARVLDEASRFAAAWASTDISSKEDQGG